LTSTGFLEDESLLEGTEWFPCLELRKFFEKDQILFEKDAKVFEKDEELFEKDEKIFEKFLKFHDDFHGL
jgi:hypothetical protein